MQHHNIVFHEVLKHIPWAIVDRLVEKHEADWDPRVLKKKPHLIAMLYAQFGGLRGLRQIEATSTPPGVTTGVAGRQVPGRRLVTRATASCGATCAQTGMPPTSWH